jgi:hypothetical protein
MSLFPAVIHKSTFSYWKQFAAIVANLLLASICAVAQEQLCTPQFPFQQQWLGADAAYSIPLPDGRSVWIFGDTMYGDKRVVVGDDPRMVRNSIGVSRCTDGKWQLDYTIRKGKNGGFQDFFKARKKDTWYWALDGFYHNNKLWVTLLCIRAVPVTASAALGFETCGTDLAKVSGLDRDPQQWTVEILPFVEDGVKAYPSSTTVVDGKFAYLFALYETIERPLLVTRIPLSGLDEPKKFVEYLAKDGTWKPGFDPKNAKPMMAHGNTEMTIRYHPGVHKWVAVMNYTKLFSDKIILRVAPKLTGPWTEGEVIYRVPEMQKDKAGFDADTFCYAGKEHPEFRDKDSILITYACNTKSVPKLVTNTGIYFPQVVRIPLSKYVKADTKKKSGN